MFGLGWIKIAIFAGIVLAIGGTIFAGYKYVGNLQQEIQILTANNATLAANVETLKTALRDQRAALESVRKDVKLKDDILQSTLNDFAATRTRVKELEKKLSDHDLGFLASEKPKLVENIINNATKNIERCFEISSGSPLTEKEKSATLPSEINSECPELANPNYMKENK